MREIRDPADERLSDAYPGHASCPLTRRVALWQFRKALYSLLRLIAPRSSATVWSWGVLQGRIGQARQFTKCAPVELAAKTRLQVDVDGLLDLACAMLGRAPQ